MRRKQNNRERAEHIKYLPMLNRGYFNDMKNTQAFPHLNIFLSFNWHQMKWNFPFASVIWNVLRCVDYECFCFIHYFTYFSSIFPFYYSLASISFRYTILIFRFSFYGSHSIYLNKFTLSLFPSFSRLIIIIIQSIQNYAWRHQVLPTILLRTTVAHIIRMS